MKEEIKQRMREVNPKEYHYDDNVYEYTIEQCAEVASTLLTEKEREIAELKEKTEALEQVREHLMDKQRQILKIVLP